MAVLERNRLIVRKLTQKVIRRAPMTELVIVNCIGDEQYLRDLGQVLAEREAIGETNLPTTIINPAEKKILVEMGFLVGRTQKALLICDVGRPEITSGSILALRAENVRDVNGLVLDKLPTLGCRDVQERTGLASVSDIFVF